ncbi:DNA double-strand break repair nuclease NurA [Thermus sediminis]|uniref:DNA double-strand break repair nuclease NurA n=1 Tax=Thermus sediminis TaxID=1761908 RepID=UPI000E3EC2F0|nr:DNA double-strand break repair nuclease NurA [Thermus sediminis]
MWRLLSLSPGTLAQGEALQEAPEPQAFHPLESPWEPRRAGPSPWPEPLYFVDGKEREEALLQGEGLALLGCVAAGALVHQGGRMTLLPPLVRRVGVGLAEPLRVGELLYEPVAAEGTDYASLRAGLQRVREELEREVARGLSGGLLLVDGPVRFARPGGLPLLGYVKTHWARYLPEGEEALLQALSPGERTPAFRVRRGGRELASWYLRLPLLPEGLRPPQAGLLRVETPLEAPFSELADLSLGLFPDLASHPVKDPRAPQNLAPIGALEWALGRRMGSQEVVERLLRRHLGGG